MRKNILIRVIFYWSIYALILITVRFGVTHTITRGFLIWNLILAWAPLLFTYLIEKTPSLRYLYIVLWFLFLPNAFYLLTDLKHLSTDVSFATYWLDMVILFSVAVIGMFLGVIAVREMKKYLDKNYKKTYSRLIIALAFLLSGYGIYLGRFPRLNSWHVFTNPISSIQAIFESTKRILTTPDQLFFVLLFTVSFGVFYEGYKKIDEKLSQ